MSRERYPKPARFGLALIAGQAALGCAFAQTQVNELAWRLTVVDANGGGQPSLIYQHAPRPPFLFSSRGPFIAYFREGLRLAQLNGTTWNFSTIDSMREAGNESSLAFSRDGYPNIAYGGDLSGTVLRVTGWMLDGCFPGWTALTVDRFQPSRADSGESVKPSLAFGTGRQSAIAYYAYNSELSTGELRFARSDAFGFAWSKSTVDRAAGSPSLANSPNLQPSIAYPSSTGLRYAQLTFSTWNSFPVDSGGDSPSLAFAGDGQPVVAYRANGQLRFARFNGAIWSTFTVDASGQSPSLAIDPRGQPAIAYATTGPLRFARFDGSNWSVVTVDPAGGQTPSLAFGPDGFATIAYTRDGVRFAQEVLAPPVITAAPQSQTTIAGGQTTLSVNAAGGNLTYQWRLNGVDIPGATSATHAIPSVQIFHSGTYTVLVSNSSGSATSLPVFVTVNATTRSDARLTNISNRAFCGTGSQALICGFVVSNEGAKTLLIRVVGPTLGAAFGVSGVLTDPILRLYRRETDGTETLILANDDWNADPLADRATTAAVTAQVGAFALPAASKDAALVATLRPGLYTVQASGAGGGTGVALVEVYEVP